MTIMEYNLESIQLNLKIKYLNNIINGCNKLNIDTLYYLEHQLKNPLKTIFDILLGEEECNKLFQRTSLIEAKKREKVSIGDAKRKNEKNKDIRSFFNITS